MKHDIVTITTSSGSDFQLPMAALQKNTPESVLLGMKKMPYIMLLSKSLIESCAYCECLTCKMGPVFILLGLSITEATS